MPEPITVEVALAPWAWALLQRAARAAGMRPEGLLARLAEEHFAPAAGERDPLVAEHLLGEHGFREEGGLAGGEREG